jgi:hypothetical protein
MKATEPIEGIIQGGDNTVDSDSELSSVSSRRYSSLEENWWKEKEQATGAENIGASTATLTVVRTRSKGKRVHWE